MNTARSQHIEEIQTGDGSDEYMDVNIGQAIFDSKENGNKQAATGANESTWEKVKVGHLEYEGEFSNSRVNGFARMYSERSAVAYHGMFKDSKFDGEGCYFFANGDRFEGVFRENKPIGQGILASRNQRKLVFCDGSTSFDEGASPNVLGDAEDEVLSEEARVTISAMSKGLSSCPFGLGNYTHCRPIDAKLALAVPFRAHEQLQNADSIEGKIAVVMRGGCGFATKVDNCQRAGAIAVVIVGCDNDTKYRHVYQVLEDDADVLRRRGTALQVRVTLPPSLPPSLQ
jgi:hypothetical protein